MQIAWFPPDAPLTRNQLRCAPQASAASGLGLLKRDVERVGADVDSLHAGGEVEPQRRVADRGAQPGVGTGPALVAGDVEPPGIRRGVADERVEVGRLALVHEATVIPAARFGSAGAEFSPGAASLATSPSD